VTDPHPDPSALRARIGPASRAGRIRIRKNDGFPSMPL
jgi:hypothetical protein